MFVKPVEFGFESLAADREGTQHGAAYGGEIGEPSPIPIRLDM